MQLLPEQDDESLLVCVCACVMLRCVLCLYSPIDCNVNQDKPVLRKFE